MPRKKGKSKTKERQKKLVQVIDVSGDRTKTMAMEEAAFLELVKEENLFCFNFESFSAVTVRGEDPGEDTWCPSADAEPGRLFTHEVVYIDFSSKFPDAVAVLRQRKLEKDMRSLLQQELIEAEMAQKEKSLRLNSPSTQITYTDLDTQTTNTVSTKAFQKVAMKHKWFVFNEAACHILYQMPSGGGSVENPRYWHYELEWEKFHMEGHVYVEVRRAIHDVLEEADKEVETGESSQQAQVDTQRLMLAEVIVEDMQALAAIEHIDEDVQAEALDEDVKAEVVVQAKVVQQTAEGVQALVVEHTAEGVQAEALEHIDEDVQAEVTQRVDEHAQAEAMDIEGGNGTKAETNKEASKQHGKQQALAEEALASLEAKGNKATVKDLCMACHVVVSGIFNHIKCLSEDFSSKFNRMEFELIAMKQEIVMLNDSVSRATERSSRSSFADLCKSLPPFAQAIYPVTNKVLPYKPSMQVERLGMLCSRPGLRDSGLSAHPTPRHAEIDVLLKMLVSGSGLVPIQSPMVGAARTSTMDESVAEPFNQVAIAEVTRSMNLCSLAAEYNHPKALSNNKSTKLLYKFVQLERGLRVVMQYYGVTLDSVFGVAIISPSFQKTHQPKKLVSKVLQHCPELTHLGELHQRNRVWLLDI